MSCILCHRGVQLILAYSWARPAKGKGREVMFLFLLFLLIVLGFNDTSTLVGHPREREKRDGRDSRRDEREGQGRKQE